MFWTFGGLYLLLLQSLACGTFAWARWRDPGFADGSGFWISAGLTIVLGLCGLGFEIVCLFWDQGSGRRWWTSTLRAMLFLALGAVAVVGLGPFGQAAIMRLTMQGSL